MKKPKISAEVSQQEFDAYKAEAARMGMTMSEWLRRSLNSSINSQTRPSLPSGAEAAFQQLDAQDALDGGILAPQPAPVAPAASPALQGLPKAPPATSGHPCVNLNPERPGMLSAGECHGTCMATSQRGKPCFYNAVTANHCPLFSSRTVPPAPVQGSRARR
jgi:hypothetical protein